MLLVSGCCGTHKGLATVIRERYNKYCMSIVSNTSNIKSSGQDFILKKVDEQEGFKIIDRRKFKVVGKDFLIKKDKSASPKSNFFEN